MNAYDSWLQQPYADQDREAAEFEQRIEARAQEMADDLVAGRSGRDIDYVFEDCDDVLREIAAVAFKPGSELEEIAADIRTILCRRIDAIAKVREEKA